jgi:hypothetical protein
VEYIKSLSYDIGSGIVGGIIAAWIYDLIKSRGKK